MAGAPRYRIWPPVALGLPLVAGLIATSAADDPVELSAAARLGARADGAGQDSIAPGQ